MRGRTSGDAARVGSATDPAHTCLPSEVPTTSGDVADDPGSSVSGVTAAGAGTRADLGARTQARAREIEDEISRFCADSPNRITVSARNYIICSSCHRQTRAITGTTGRGAPGDRGTGEAGLAAERPSSKSSVAERWPSRLGLQFRACPATVRRPGRRRPPTLERPAG
ncbi:hypothetical protein HPB50_028683 [Hyalomma asiaticum]|nr:hypothetical protein HPB50_028683 [Hyalomma asiaticum]